MLKKILAPVFVLSVSVSSVSANSFRETLFGSPDASVLVDSVGFVFDANFTSQETIGNIVLNVRRTGGGSDAFSVDFTTLDNSATAPNDYTQTQITVNFAAGEDLKQVSIPIINDVDAEPIEYFAVQPANGVQLGSNVFNFVSIYPDEPIVLTFNATTPENQNAEVYFERAGSDLSATVTLDYGTANETAIAGQDYTSQNGTVIFLPNETVKTVLIPITLARGRGIARARVSITNQTGEIKMAMTNQFGYFRFNEVETGQTYFVQVTSKSYRFTPQTLSIDGDLDGVNFTAIE